MPPSSDASLAQIQKSAADGKLIAVVGTGVSVALTDGKNKALSWKGLIEGGFEFGVRKGKITDQQKTFWNNQLQSEDIDDVLGAAEFVTRKLGAPKGELYARWLQSTFQNATAAAGGMANAIRAIYAANVPICTLNYDLLLEQTIGAPGITLLDVPKVTSWIRRENRAILHLHGQWETPESCILGIRDYETTISNEIRDLIQRNLSTFNHLLFIGCGDTFSDPNFSTLISWLRRNIKLAAPQHYALVTSTEAAKRHSDETWHGFVEPVSYGSEYRDLPEFLLKQFPTKVSGRATKKSTARSSTSRSKREKVLEEYRAFLLRDCGQMTIEGMRADIDTAQRKFDLERLFVPIQVSQTPPDFAATDPDGEQKLLKWLEKNGRPLPFGAVLLKNRRIALLALPGGGKSLLLKRLAVAYADPSRQKGSDDALPDLPLMPVLIRCREWREHICRPILSLLQNMPTITGQASLRDLSEALVPLLKKGSVLLLVDGLDEIHNDADRATFVDNLEAFLAQYKSVRLVVTSREAGFGLVAPPISRFCSRWRLAPLSPDAIRKLCDHWHRLMTGDIPESLAEGLDVAKRILSNDALHRLAENPLLLTMLLVVKHGAGRLPPDRVSLYDRAVEVLLDTWNIKGHDALNLKEAVPQLACVAFELMRRGRQTATENTLLAILEEARESLPQIRRYAKDTPHDFLKRVELRSSLLVEAGHQLEGAKTVPFYQFRHLTFQEHLAAVAAAEGHYIGYQKNDTVLSPLLPHLASEEWKEVIPMAAVLARKQAEPLLNALVLQATRIQETFLQGKEWSGREGWMRGKLPGPVSRLVQALAEEAQAASETITHALQLIAFFARGCDSRENWQQLVRGPYGAELLHQCWNAYANFEWPAETWIRNSLACFSAYARSFSYWASDVGQREIVDKLGSDNTEELDCNLLTIAGWYWTSGRRPDGLIEPHAPMSDFTPLKQIEARISSDQRSTWIAASWAWALTRQELGRRKLDRDPPDTTVLDLMLRRWISQQDATGITTFALSTTLGMPRASWTPILKDSEKTYIREMDTVKGLNRRPEDAAVAVLIAFHSEGILIEKELVGRMERLYDRPAWQRSIEAMLGQFPEGITLLQQRKERANRLTSADPHD